MTDGHAHDDTKVLIDPYARAIVSRRQFGELGPELGPDAELPGVCRRACSPAAWGGISKTSLLCRVRTDVAPDGLLAPGLERLVRLGGRPAPQPAHGGADSRPPFRSFLLPLRTPSVAAQDLVIYEMHVRGFTQHPSSGVGAPGTYQARSRPGRALDHQIVEAKKMHESFQGMTERLDYLKSLGVNCIELMPVHEFNELEYYQVIPGTDTYRVNYWGYRYEHIFAGYKKGGCFEWPKPWNPSLCSTVGFFSPMSRFSQSAKEGGSGEDVVREFKSMVREAHKRGIEVIHGAARKPSLVMAVASLRVAVPLLQVILDVVFNHTAEGNQMGPTLAFRGLDNRVYYMLAPKARARPDSRLPSPALPAAPSHP